MSYDLKKEEDVKEYLEKLGVEYRFGCFSEKNPDACQRLGEYLETIKKDYDKAIKVYKNNCDDYSYGKSCFQYALLGLKGKGPKQIREDVPAYFEKGCAAGYSESCTTGGMMLLTSSGDPPSKDPTAPMGPAATRRRAEAGAAAQKAIVAICDEPREPCTETKRLFPLRKKGLDLLQRGCELNNGFACYFISALYIEGKDTVEIVPDFAEAFKYSEKACRLGQPQACGNMSTMYKRGQGVAKDEAKSELYKAMALDMVGQRRQRIELQRGT